MEPNEQNLSFLRNILINTLSPDAKAIKDAERAQNVRNQRNELLKDSDWTQIADSPVNKENWAAYRQSLRNLPSAEGFPWTVTFPSKPA